MDLISIDMMEKLEKRLQSRGYQVSFIIKPLELLMIVTLKKDDAKKIQAVMRGARSIEGG